MDEFDLIFIDGKGGIGVVDRGKVDHVISGIGEDFDHDAATVVFDDDFISVDGRVVGFDDDEFAVADAGFHAFTYTA